MITKRRGFSTLLCLGAALALPVDASANETVSDIVEQVTARYADVSTFSARFKQRSGAYARTADATGKVTFAKPGKMSWRYANGNRVVSDGAQVRIFEKEAGQMWELPVARTLYPMALSFLLGREDFGNTFRFALLDPKRTHYAKGNALSASLTQPSESWDRVVFYVDARAHDVQRVVIFDQQGNQHRLDFSVLSRNPAVPSEEFAFTPPPGTRIIRR